MLQKPGGGGGHCAPGKNTVPLLSSGVAGGGICVVSVEGRGPGAVAPGKIFRLPPQNNGGFVRFRVQKKIYKTEKPLPDER